MGGDVMARPIELDDLKAQRICAAVAAGNTRQCAAAAAGIGFSTLIQWARRGRKGEEPYAAFAARLAKADAEAEMAKVQVIGEAAEKGSWQAAAFWLQYRRHRTWRKPAEQMEAAVDYSQVPLEQLEQSVQACVELRKKASNG